MQHLCLRCGYEWGEPKTDTVADLCGFCRTTTISQARNRMAAGEYDRIEVIDAVSELVARELENER